MTMLSSFNILLAIKLTEGSNFRINIRFYVNFLRKVFTLRGEKPYILLI